MNLYEEYLIGLGNPAKKSKEQVLKEVQTTCLRMIKEGEKLPYKIYISNMQDMSPKEIEILLCINNIVATCIEYVPLQGDKELHLVIKEFTQPTKKVDVKLNNPTKKGKQDSPSFKKWWFNDGFNNWGY